MFQQKYRKLACHVCFSMNDIRLWIGFSTKGGPTHDLTCTSVIRSSS